MRLNSERESWPHYPSERFGEGVKTSSPPSRSANSGSRLYLFQHCLAPARKLCFAAMRHQLDFEKPILELESKLEELKKHPEKHSLAVSFKQEIEQIEKKIAETR